MEKGKTNKTQEKERRTIMPGFWAIYAVFIVAMLVVFTVAMVSTLSKKQELTAQKAELEESIAEEQERNAELSMEGDYYKSDEYYEKIAREKLGLVMPNEITFIDQNK